MSTIEKREYDREYRQEMRREKDSMELNRERVGGWRFFVYEKDKNKILAERCVRYGQVLERRIIPKSVYLLTLRQAIKTINKMRSKRV